MRCYFIIISRATRGLYVGYMLRFNQEPASQRVSRKPRGCASTAQPPQVVEVDGYTSEAFTDLVGHLDDSLG